eukprot:TRINITY_DN39927_c0_g1_i1.p1 TRINITY_DN39927_c0_g1~~TRINITY_DN39927_c0_g1_i1.p1  ORF type:complete len:648 (+),score=159.70 TRINITY_DN39927_c0_g1_i1:68-2011(+)
MGSGRSKQTGGLAQAAEGAPRRPNSASPQRNRPAAQGGAGRPPVAKNGLSQRKAPPPAPQQLQLAARSGFFKAVPPLPLPPTDASRRPSLPAVQDAFTRRLPLSPRSNNSGGTPPDTPCTSAHSAWGLLSEAGMDIDAPNPIAASQALHTAGLTDLELGNAACAAASLARCLRLQRRLLGDLHPLTAHTQLTLASALDRAGRTATATAILRTADACLTAFSDRGFTSPPLPSGTSLSEEDEIVCFVSPSLARLKHLQLLETLAECFCTLADSQSGAAEASLLTEASNVLRRRAGMLESLPAEEKEDPLWPLQVVELRRLALLEERRGHVPAAKGLWKEALEVERAAQLAARRLAVENAPKLVTYQGKHAAKNMGGAPGWWRSVGAPRGAKSPPPPGPPAPRVLSPPASPPVVSPASGVSSLGDDPVSPRMGEAEAALAEAREHLRRLQSDPKGVVAAARMRRRRPSPRQPPPRPPRPEPIALTPPEGISPTSRGRRASGAVMLPSHYVSDAEPRREETGVTSVTGGTPPGTPPDGTPDTDEPLAEPGNAAPPPPQQPLPHSPVPHLGWHGESSASLNSVPAAGRALVNVPAVAQSPATPDTPPLPESAETPPLPPSPELPDVAGMLDALIGDDPIAKEIMRLVAAKP